jgi:hypothetical protein
MQFRRLLDRQFVTLVTPSAESRFSPLETLKKGVSALTAIQFVGLIDFIARVSISFS